jgi:hypothetical protein
MNKYYLYKKVGENDKFIMERDESNKKERILHDFYNFLDEYDKEWYDLDNDTITEERQHFKRYTIKYIKPEDVEKIVFLENL